MKDILEYVGYGILFWFGITIIWQVLFFLYIYFQDKFKSKEKSKAFLLKIAVILVAVIISLIFTSIFYPSNYRKGIAVFIGIILALWILIWLFSLCFDVYKTSFSSRKQINASMKTILISLKSIVLVIIGIIVLFYLLVLFYPVFEGVQSGFDEVGNNIKESWLGDFLFNFAMYVLIFFTWVFALVMSILFGIISTIVLIAIFRWILFRVFRISDIPYFPFPPEKGDLIEISVFVVALLSFLLLAIYCFVDLFLFWLINLNYGPF